MTNKKYNSNDKGNDKVNDKVNDKDEYRGLSAAHDDEAVMLRSR